MRHTLWILCIFAFVSQPAHAHLWHDDIMPSIENSIEPTNLLILGIGAAGVAVLRPNDHHLNPRTPKEIGFNKRISSLIEPFGTGVPNLIIVATQWRYDGTAARSHLSAMAFTVLTTTALKATVHRTRPNGDNDQSFPSGHTGLAFTSATSLYMNYGWEWGIPAYALATLVGLERMADSYHWASDVWAGAALGIIWGRASYYAQAKRNEVTFLKHFTPIISPQVVGMVFQHEF